MSGDTNAAGNDFTDGPGKSNMQFRSLDSGTSPGTRTGSRPVQIGIFVALAGVAVDQAVKAFMLLVMMSPPRVIPVTPFFNLRLGFNTGISFGLFSSDSPCGPWVLSAVAVAIVLFLAAFLFRSRKAGEAAGLGAIIGGALGNVIDRIRQGAVTDFLDFYTGSWHWPAFNLADAAITLGATMLFLRPLFAWVARSIREGGR